MARHSWRVSFALAYSACLFAPAAKAEDPPLDLPGQSFPLDENDRRMITLQVLEKHPLVASSPGIKFAEAWHSNLVMPSGQQFDTAQIVYYPHTESAGIKKAFQVSCTREISGELWTCDHAELRRYMQLDSQDFEVRVTGSLKHDEVLALIQATRGVVQASANRDSKVPDTAIIIHPANDGYLVGWGSPEGYGELMVEAHLRSGGNPANPEDWRAGIFQPED